MKGKTKSILAVSSKMTLLCKWPITWNDELSMHVKTIFHFASTLNRRLKTFWHVLNTKGQILLVLRHQTSFPHFMTAVSFFFFFFCSAWRRLQVFSRAWHQSDVVHLFKSRSGLRKFSRPEQFTALYKIFHFKLNWNTYLVEHTTVNVKTCPLTEHQTTLQNIAWKRRLPRTKHGYMWLSSTQTSVEKKTAKIQGEQIITTHHADMKDLDDIFVLLSQH